LRFSTVKPLAVNWSGGTRSNRGIVDVRLAPGGELGEIGHTLAGHLIGNTSPRWAKATTRRR